MCEPLRGKKINNTDSYAIYEHFKFNDIKSAVKFYKKYSRYSNCNPEFVFKRKQPKAYKLWNKVRNKIYKQMKYPCFDTIDKIHFNSWLFDYCFGDVI